MPYLLWSLSVKTQNGKAEKHFQKCAMGDLFLAARAAQTNSLTYLTSFYCFIYWLSKAWLCTALGGKAPVTPQQLLQPVLLRLCNFLCHFLFTSLPRCTWEAPHGWIYFSKYSLRATAASQLIYWEVCFEKNLSRHRVRSDSLCGVVDVCADHTHSEHPAALEALSPSPGSALSAGFAALVEMRQKLLVSLYFTLDCYVWSHTSALADDTPFNRCQKI